MQGDELDVVQQPSTISKANAAETNGEAIGAAATTSNIQSWDADSDGSVAAQILKSSGMPYVKVSEGNPARIAFVPGGHMVGGPTHYDPEDKRYYICDSTKTKRAACCKKFGESKGRAAAYVFRYLNADTKTAKLDQNATPEVEVQIFTMSRGTYEDVKNSVEEGGSVFGLDFKISVAEKQLQRKVNAISHSPRWKAIEKQALEMAAPFLADERQLKRALGREFGGGNIKGNLLDPEVEEM